jgi:hypothetical protein
MPIATPQGTLDFKSVDKVTFVGASSNTVIDTTTGSLGVGVGVGGPTSNLHVVGDALITGNVSDLNVVSNVNMLHTSNTASIKLNSNVVAEFPRSKKFMKFPRVAMSQNDESLTSGYVVSTSSNNWGLDPGYKLFNNNTGDYWHTDYPLYSGTSPYIYTASNAISTYNGEWVTIDLGQNIKLDNVSLYNRNGYTNQAASQFVILGGSDNLNWNLLSNVTSTSWISLLPNIINVKSEQYYRYYAFVFTHANSSTNIALGELELFGVPEYDPEAHGTDVVVKSVPNVPNTDWLEVYYDAKGLATGAVTTVNDLKPSSLGSAINSSSTNNITVADDAFVFNGTDSYIKINDLTNPLGAWVHSVVAWVKFTDFDSSCEVSWIGDADGTSIRQSFSFQPGGETVTMGISVSNVQFRFTSPLTAGKWHHVVYTYNGGQAGSTSTAYQVFIDGVEAQQFSGAGSGTLTLPADSALWIGRNHQGANHFGGSIANFRLFNRALTSDEIYQLYAYQKEYFGHGDLSMTLKAGRLGIGTSEPRAMLDVRGNFHSQNMICQTQQYEYYSGSVTVSSGSTTVLTCPFTPKYSNSKILIELSCPVQSSATYFNIFVNRGSSRITSNPGIYGIISYNSGTNLSGHFIHTGIGYDLPGTTSTINYNVVAEYGGGASIIILTGSGKLLVFIHELCQ